MRRLFFLIPLAVIGLGVYLKLFYDVPDSEAGINFFTSWFLIIIGTSGFLISIFWKSGKPGGKDKD